MGTSAAPVREESAISPIRRSRPTNGQNPRNFKFERADWTLFRSISTLPQKAGVPARRLRRLILKELVDNALDAGGKVEVGEIEGGVYYIQDDGHGIEPDEIATLFSIDRPMVTSKLLRLPTRGALGNGCRVVAGAVLASSGRLVVYTRNRRILVVPHDNGSSTTIIEPADFPIGTRIEIWFGRAMPEDELALAWAKLATRIGHAGSSYKGRTSPHWFDADSFFELLQAAGDRLVYDLIADFDGCSGAKAGRITVEFKKMRCADVDRGGARRLLRSARELARVVKPSRLGAIGPDADLEPHHAKVEGHFMAGATMPARVPFVAEAWADAKGIDDTVGDFMMNRTPITGTVGTFHGKGKLRMRGCGLGSVIDVGRRNFYFTINITTPYCPYTTDGKQPDLSMFQGAIEQVVKKAVGRARRAAPVVVTSNPDSLLPQARSGRRSEAEEHQYQAQLDRFCRKIIEIRKTLDFDISERGWCYTLEDFGLHKGDFDRAERVIKECRKTGRLPLDIVADDSAREFAHVEVIDKDNPEQKARAIIDGLWRAHLGYAPVSLWDGQPYYVQMLVEKIDLKSLFSPVCEEFHIPIANARGRWDYNSRADLMRRFQEREATGQKIVLLYCGDHDPSGLQISGGLRKDIDELADAVGWRANNLVIDRFGLNADFIEQHGLTWIENLETGSGKRLDDPNHTDHGKDYVQSYIKKFGVRKVEANALVVRHEAGRELCREAIRKYVPDDAPAKYAAKLKPLRDDVEAEIRRLIRESIR